VIPSALPLPFTFTGHSVSAVRQVVPYFVEIPGQGMLRRTAEYFGWSCTCGEVSRPENRWSHEHLAVDMGMRHAEQLGIAS